MKAQKLSVVLATLILLTAANAQEAEELSKAEVSNTRTASCLVKVTCDSAILPLNPEIIDHLLSSSGVTGKAARKVLDLSLDETYEIISIEPLSSETAGVQAKPSSVITTAEIDVFGSEKPETFSRRPRARRTRGRRGPEPDEPEFQRSYVERPGKVMVLEETEIKIKKPLPRARRTPATRGIARQPQWQSAGMPPPPIGGRPMLLFQLQVELPENVRPAAEEFMNAIINNLRRTLMEAYRAYEEKVNREYHGAEHKRDWARSELYSTMGLSNDTDADIRTRQQLDDEVDLSEWRPEMGFGEAIEILTDSTGPPLPIVVLWQDLNEYAEIDRTTPINMDPISAIPAGKALELLLKAVSVAELAYEIDKGVITIATRESLPSREQKFSQITRMDAPVEMLLDRRNELFREKQDLEMEVARLEASRSAFEQQIAGLNKDIAFKVRTDQTTVEFRPLLEQLERQRKDIELNINKGPDYRDRLTEVLEKITSTKLELADRRQALVEQLGGDQLADFSRQLADLAIKFAEKKAQFEVVNSQLEQMEEQLEIATAFDPEISQMRLAKEALEVAERRLNELKIHQVSLQPPTVTILGAN